MSAALDRQVAGMRGVERDVAGQPPGRRTMRAALLLGVGGPEMLEVRDDVPVPEVAPGDVLVHVGACGVNNTDINTRVGWYSRTVTTATTGSAHMEASSHDAGWSRGGLTYPRIQGADVVGTVTDVGGGVSDDLIGRRVLVDPWLRGIRYSKDSRPAGYLGSERDGGFAEYCSVPSENAHPVSSDLADVELATFACSWSTAEHMLQRVDLRSGETIAVPGASGGVGSALVQLAKLRGARVVAITSAAKLDDVAALGPDRIVTRQGNRVPEDAMEANGSPFHVVADVVGGPDFGGWLEALRQGGRYATSGAIAGPMVELDLRTLYLKDLTLHGATVYEPQVFSDLVGHIEGGRVRAVVGGVYRLEDIHAAQEAFMAKRHTGSLVIRI